MLTLSMSAIGGKADIQPSSPRNENFGQTGTLADLIHCPLPTLSSFFHSQAGKR
jgi:hypothetical protein